MQVNRPLQSLLNRLDTNQNGLSLNELKSLDSDQSGSLNAAEAEAAGIQNPEDRALLNEALQNAKTYNLSGDDIVFPLRDADTEGSAKTYHFLDTPPPSEPRPNSANPVTPGQRGRPPGQVERMSHDAFNPMDPDLGRRLVRLDQALGGADQQVGRPFTYRNPAAAGSTAQLNVAGGVSMGGFDDLKSFNRESVRQHLQAAGTAPSEAQIDAYIQQHGEDMAQQLGADLNGKYSSWTQIGLTGDVNTLDPFRSTGSDDESKVVVCTNIHASVAAYRREVLGQEAYIMTTNGNDQAHIVTVFKDNNTNSWNIQNYGTVVQTDAKDLRELFENYLPDQRQILLGDVKEDGIKVLRNVRTPLGERELRFRSQLGAGNYSPHMGGSSEVQLGTNRINVNHGGFNLNFDPNLSTLGLNYHTRTQEGSRLNTRGVGVELQDFTNPHGFQRERIDAKYESETVGVEQIGPGHERFTRSYWNVHAGIENTSQAGPIYWQNNDDTGAAARLGGMYSHTQSHLFGTQPLRLELGHQFNAGVTATVGTQGDQWFSNYVTRTLGDAVLETKPNLGLRYDQNGFMARGGISPSLNAANINGISHFGQQVDNMFGLEAYGEMGYQNNQLRVSVMGTADLRHENVFQVGLMGDLRLTENLNWSTILSHQNDPLLGNRSAIMTGLQAEFTPGLSFFTQVGADLQATPQANMGLVWRPGAGKRD